MGKPDKEKIKLLRQKGYTFKEIAEELGLTKEAVAWHCRKMGMGGMIKQVKPEARPIKEVKAMVKSKNNSIEYVGGYKNNTSDVKLLCTVCGETFAMNWNSYMHSKKAECPVCRKRKSEKAKEDLRVAKEERQLALIRKNAVRQLVARRLRDIRVKEKHICCNCGKEYTIKQTRYNSEKYCSFKCFKRYINKTNRDKRIKKIKAVELDKDITLEKLYHRDKGICWICQSRCDLTDYVVVGNTIVCGNNYPSIDHVKPLSKGGKHSWDNVRLACRLCNSIKGDKISPRPLKFD